jgi:hypothetical protein
MLAKATWGFEAPPLNLKLPNFALPCVQINVRRSRRSSRGARSCCGTEIFFRPFDPAACCRRWRGGCRLDPRGNLRSQHLGAARHSQSGRQCRLGTDVVRESPGVRISGGFLAAQDAEPDISAETPSPACWQLYARGKKLAARVEVHLYNTIIQPTGFSFHRFEAKALPSGAIARAGRCRTPSQRSRTQPRPSAQRGRTKMSYADRPIREA